MAEFILDASVAISWCFPGDPSENTPYSRSVLRRLDTDEAVVPEIWPFEIANGLYGSCVRRGRITEPQIHEYLELLKSLPVRVAARNLWENVDLESLARRRNLAAYDAAYLHLAKSTKLALATLDSPLKRAATSEGVVVVE